MAGMFTLPGVLLSGTHAARPAASAVAQGTLYAETDTAQIYQSDGASTWTAWGAAGLVDPTTTRGDLLVRGASSLGRLAVGAANRVLRSDGTDPSWGQVVEGDLGLTDITTANVSTSKHGLAPKLPNDATKYLDGTGAYSVPAGGGGGGLSLPVFRQAGKASNGGGGPGNLVLPSAPVSGNLLVCLAAANGAGISSISQAGVTWTQRRHDNVAAVGALDLWTGAVGASASATATISGMTGAASATIWEVVSGTYSALGSSSLYGSSLSNKIGGPLSGIAVGHLIAFIVNTAGAGPNGPCMLSCPCSWSWEAGVNQFALGVATGQDVMAYYPGGGTFSLIEIVP